MTVPDLGDYSSLPGVHRDVDQIVAGNVRLWRRAARLTQEELGERIGWSGANVSAAERSAAEGRDKRRFDAHALAAIAMAIGIPVAALFLPPADDGESKRYLFHALEGTCSGMADLTSLLLPPADDSPLAAEWRRRLGEVADKYLDESRAWELGEYMEDMSTSQSRARLLERITTQRAVLAGMLDDLTKLIEVIGEEGI